jgi:hemerythrin-like domain-containing protein
VNPTEELLNEHVIIRRIRDITQRCSDVLYDNWNVPFEDIEIITVVMNEFIDNFHNFKEEKSYFPVTNDKDENAEDIRKFLIEHELGRRIANMLLKEVHKWKNGIESKEPIARFLKSYSVYISDHTGKEDKFFNKILLNNELIETENRILIEQFTECKKSVGGENRIKIMLGLIDYLEKVEWMKGIQTK